MLIEQSLFYIPTYTYPLPQVHEGMMLASVVLTAVSLAVIFIAHVGRRVSGLVDLSVSLTLAHFVIGIIVAGGQIFNLLVALSRCKPSSRFRWIYNILHGKFTGYITALLSRKAPVHTIPPPKHTQTILGLVAWVYISFMHMALTSY